MGKAIRVILSAVSIFVGLFCLIFTLALYEEYPGAAVFFGILTGVFFTAPFWRRIFIKGNAGLPDTDAPSVGEVSVACPWEEDPDTAGLWKPKEAVSLKAGAAPLPDGIQRSEYTQPAGYTKH